MAEHITEAAPVTLVAQVADGCLDRPLHLGLQVQNGHHYVVLANHERIAGPFDQSEPLNEAEAVAYLHGAAMMAAAYRRAFNLRARRTLRDY